MWRILRLIIIVSIAIGAGIIGLILTNNYMTTIEDLPIKGTIAAAAITLFGVIFSAMYKEISAYYQERSEISCRKWELIFPFIKKYYNAWIHSAESLQSSLEKLNPNKLSRTDWKVGNIFIEYAGLMDDSEYASKMKRKKQLADKNGLQLIIIGPADLFSLDEKLKTVIIEKVS